MLVCNNCHTKEVALRGTVLEPRLLVSSLDGTDVEPEKDGAACAIGVLCNAFPQKIVINGSAIATWLSLFYLRTAMHQLADPAEQPLL